MKDDIRTLLEEWARLDEIGEYADAISSLRWYVSHDKWPRKREKTQTFEYDFSKVFKPSLSRIKDVCVKCLDHYKKSMRIDLEPNTMVRRQNRSAIYAILHSLFTAPANPIEPCQDYQRYKWKDKRKCLPDGTKIWNDDGSPRMSSLVGRKKEFEKHGGGGHDYIGFMRAYKSYKIQQTQEELKKPPKPRVKTKKEVAEDLALKNQQRETARRRREALDALDKANFQRALKEREKQRQSSAKAF